VDGDHAPLQDFLLPALLPSRRDIFTAGLALFWQAHEYAREAGADLWDFALERDALLAAGLSVSDLRWLVARQLAEHGRETTVCGEAHRSFQRGAGFTFERDSCFVLSPRGISRVGEFLQAASEPGEPRSRAESSESLSESAPQVEGEGAREDMLSSVASPKWDSKLRELYMGDELVKRFRVPARNQETILTAFEEEGWPEHIDDPIPVTDNIDPHTRLHDAINRLNGCQSNPLLRFHGNGSGTGVSWAIREPTADAEIAPRRQRRKANKQVRDGRARKTA